VPFIGRGGSSPPSDTTQWDTSHSRSADGDRTAAPKEAGTSTVPAPPADATIPAAASRFEAATALLDAATAPTGVARTDRSMPHTSPPARRPSSSPARPPTGTPGTRPDGVPLDVTADAPGSTHRAVPAARGLPSSWAGAADLLAGAATTLGNRAPLNTALLETAADSAGAAPDLSAVWSVPQPHGRPDARLAQRRLDSAGRLKLPLTLSTAGKVKVSAQRHGPVLTVYLPGSTAQPAAGRLVAPLPMDDRGRLTVTDAVRTELGWEPGTDLLILFDPDQALLAVSAASVLEDSIAAAFESLRATPAASGSNPGSAKDAARTGGTATPETAGAGRVIALHSTG
jgi:hypothetical protein